MGRCESALARTFLERPDIGQAERTALRIQAHAVDVAEVALDPDAISRANATYLALRQAAGLTAGVGPAHDSFGDLLAELGRPTADTGDKPNT